MATSSGVINVSPFTRPFCNMKGIRQRQLTLNARIFLPVSLEACVKKKVVVVMRRWSRDIAETPHVWDRTFGEHQPQPYSRYGDITMH